MILLMMQALKQQLGECINQVTDLKAQVNDVHSRQGQGQTGPDEGQAVALQQRLRKIELTVAGD